MRHLKWKNLSWISLGLILFIISWVLFELIVQDANFVESNFGIDPKIFFILLVGCEIFFCVGIVLILLGSGILSIGLKSILQFSFEGLTLKNKSVIFGFAINRTAAFLPPLYLLIFGWAKLPMNLIVLVVIELMIVVTLGLLPVVSTKRAI